MLVYISLIVVFTMLISSVILNISIVLPLTAGLLIFLLIAYTQGYGPKELWQMSLNGIKKTSLIYFLLLFIGPTTSLWMICGTIPFLINRGISFISPSTFLIAVFFGTLIVGLLFGSAFATVGTIGVVFMAIARTGNVNQAVVAGVIVAAAYMGERGTPVSTTLNLLTFLTKTDIYENIKRFFMSTLVPLIVVIVFYGILSYLNPIAGNVSASVSVIKNNFKLGYITALPAMIVIILAFLKLDVRKILGASMITAFLVGLFYQGLSIQTLINSMIFGYHPTHDLALAAMLHGGGLASIIKPFFIVFIASAYGGIFQETGMLRSFQNLITKISEKFGLFAGALFTSIVSNCFGCSQTFGIVTTHQFIEDHYQKSYSSEEEGNKALSLDLGNSAMMVAPLIPWNISCAFPAAVLAVNFSFIPYELFLYLVPIYILFFTKIKLQSVKTN